MLINNKEPQKYKSLYGMIIELLDCILQIHKQQSVFVHEMVPNK